MEKINNIKVDLNEIIGELEMLTMVSESSRAFVNMQTGEFIHLDEDEDFSDVEDEDLEDEWIPDHDSPPPCGYHC